LTQKIGSLSSLSQSSGGLSGLSGDSSSDSTSTEHSVGAGINFGAFANLPGVGYQ